MNWPETIKISSKLIKEFLNTPSDLPQIVVILGATASGKSSLAMKIAQKFNGEIISADSRQVWRDFDIGTDKIGRKDRQNIPHHLIDIADARERYTLWDWKKDAEKTIDQLIKNKKLPIVAGGTGLYLDALIDNFQIPGEDPKLHQKLEEGWKIDQGQTLLKKLQKLDPKTATGLHPSSRLHLIRDLEVALQKQEKGKGERKYESLIVGLRWPREIRKQRIKKRVDEMLKQGLVDEVQNLLKKYGPQIPGMTGIGYREIVTHLQGLITLDEAHEQIIRNTYQYSRRQDTWWRRRNDINWLEITE